MIVKAGQADGFLRRPPAALRGVLLYGPDQGLVRERAAALVPTVGGDASDPFALVEIDGSGLRSDPARLGDEAAALVFAAARRVVRVRAATDLAAPAVTAWLARPGDGFVIVEAGDLAPRSSLRKAFEKAADAAAIGCYADDSAGLARVIEHHLTAAGLTIDRETVDLLASRFGGDRAIVRSELDKLITYMAGADRRQGSRVSREDAAACIGDSGAASLDAVAEATGLGDLAALETALRRTRGEGTNAVTILRAVARHFDRLLFAATAVEAGTPPDKAVASLRPPVFFKAVPGFRRQLERWSAVKAGSALSLLLETELQCKTTGLPAETICARTLFRLAQTAQRQGG